MLFLLAWLLNYDITVSTVNSVTVIALQLLGLPIQYLYVNLVVYFIFDIVSKRVKRRSDMSHHLLSLLTIFYILLCHPDIVDTVATAATAVEISTIPLNFYHDSKRSKERPKAETPVITDLISTRSWQYLFLTCFIVFRFPVYIWLLNPVITTLDLTVFYYSWLSLNSYWLVWMVKKFVISEMVNKSKKQE